MENTPESLPAPEAEPVAKKSLGWFARSLSPFRVATLRGLAIILPPLLTIILFIWAWNVIDGYVVRPVESLLTRTIAYTIEDSIEDEDVREKLASGTYSLRDEKILEDEDVREEIASGIYSLRDVKIFNDSRIEFEQIESGQWIPTTVIQQVRESSRANTNLVSSGEYYRHYVKTKHLRRHLFIPAFLALFMVVLYLLGKLMKAGIGRFFLHYIEKMITQLPIIRNVYSSVKQVTDFALNENEMTFTRIVAVEYPRRGIWSMGFVTGEGMRDIRQAAGEPILTVLMPTSPMPATGFTISIPKSETIDLDISIDQAVQFCVSCGVVIPDHQQMRNTIDGEVKSRFKQIADANRPSQNGSPNTGDQTPKTSEPVSGTDHTPDNSPSEPEAE